MNMRWHCFALVHLFISVTSIGKCSPELLSNEGIHHAASRAAFYLPLLASRDSWRVTPQWQCPRAVNRRFSLSQISFCGPIQTNSHFALRSKEEGREEERSTNYNSELDIEKLLETLEASLEENASKDGFEKEMEAERMSDKSKVLQMNNAFYEAVSHRSMEEMEQLWLRSPHVQCIHPGTKLIQGYDQVMSMWKEMFEGLKEEGGRNTVVLPLDVKAHVRGSSAFVSCIEEVSGKGARTGGRRGITRLSATNVFWKVPGGGWGLVHHHASLNTQTGDSEIGPSSVGGSATAVVSLSGPGMLPYPPMPSLVLIFPTCLHQAWY